MNEGEILLALIGVIAGLAGILGWVVKEIFKFSERHVKVVANNTLSNEAVVRTLGKVTTDLNFHAEETRAAIAENSKVMEIMGEILKTQHEIIRLLKDGKEDNELLITKRSKVG